jgi:16S rRNA (guanine1207-N2)-methyltransferase
MLNVPQGKFELQRLPQRKNEALRAWDAADEYLLDHIAEESLLEGSPRVLILNDSFGALGLALHQAIPTAVSDSWLSQQSTQLNFSANTLSLDHICLRNSLDWPTQCFDLVLIKVPKTLAMLEDQLIRLQPLLTPETRVIAAGMVKAMSSSVWKLLDKYLGETKPSLAKKKARLIFVTLRTTKTEFAHCYPSRYQLENTDYHITNHANVFSRQNLDVGTRFLLEHLPQSTEPKDVVDLGCGNGIVGLLLARDNPLASLSFVDESYMAIASAKENFLRVFPERGAKFFIADGLTRFKENSVDLIVCNPPFHQQNTVGNHIALAMFKQSYRVLSKGGELMVIGNRHLGYHLDLKRLFKQCDEIASNKKFIIWRVIK